MNTSQVQGLKCCLLLTLLDLIPQCYIVKKALISLIQTYIKSSLLRKNSEEVIGVRLHMSLYFELFNFDHLVDSFS